jgi:hypothetical protein
MFSRLRDPVYSLLVIPAKAGIHGLTVRPWTPDQVGCDNIENIKNDQKTAKAHQKIRTPSP